MNAHARPESRTVERLLSMHGRTFCSEFDIDVAANTPSALFRLFTATLLVGRGFAPFSAFAAADSFADHGLTTADRLATCRREDLRRLLRNAACIQHSADAAEMLKAATGSLLENYQGDLRALRDAAGYRAKTERAWLLALNGMNDEAADFFFQEVQPAWDETYPFASTLSLVAAGRLGLPDTVERLAGLVGRSVFPKLLAALMRDEIEHQKSEPVRFGPISSRAA